MKKVFSIILALVMALSVFSVMTLAEDPDFSYVVVSEEDKTKLEDATNKAIAGIISNNLLFFLLLVHFDVFILSIP